MINVKNPRQMIKALAFSSIMICSHAYSGVWSDIKNTANKVGNVITGGYSISAISLIEENGLKKISKPFRNSALANSALLVGDKYTLAKMPTLELDAIAKGYGLSDADLGAAWTIFRDQTVEDFETLGDGITYAGQEAYKAALEAINEAFSLCIWAAKNSDYAASPILSAAGEDSDLIDEQDAYNACSNSGLGMITRLLNSLDSQLKAYKELVKILNGNKTVLLENALNLTLGQTKTARQLLNTPIFKQLLNDSKLDKQTQEILELPFTQYANLDEIRDNLSEPNFSYHDETRKDAACARIPLPYICDSDGSDLNLLMDNLVYLEHDTENWQWDHKRKVHAIMTHAFGPSYWYKDGNFSNDLRTSVLDQYSNYLGGQTPIINSSGFDAKVPYIVEDSLLSGGMGAILSNGSDSIILLNEKLFASHYESINLQFDGDLTDQAVTDAKLVYIEELFHLINNEICQSDPELTLCLSTNDSGAMMADAVEQYDSYWSTFLDNIETNADIQNINPVYTIELADEVVTLETNNNIWATNTYLAKRKAKLRMRSRTGFSLGSGATESTVVLDINFDFPKWLTKGNGGLGSYYNESEIEDCEEWNCRALHIGMQIGIRDEVEIGTGDSVESMGSNMSYGADAAFGTSRVHNVRLNFVYKDGHGGHRDGDITRSQTGFEYANGVWGYGGFKAKHQAKLPNNQLSPNSGRMSIYIVPWYDIAAEWNIKSKSKIGTALGVGGAMGIGGCLAGSIGGSFMSKAVEGCSLGSQFAESLAVFQIAKEQYQNNKNSVAKWQGFGIIVGTALTGAHAFKTNTPDTLGSSSSGGNIEGAFKSDIRLEAVKTFKQSTHY